MIFGHLTVTAAGYHLVKTRLGERLSVPLAPLLVGAYVPDLLDKPIAFVTGLSGRGYGHSIVVEAAFFALALGALCWRGKPSPAVRALLIALALGTVLHLVEDWVTLDVLLAPLLGPIPLAPQVPLLEKIVLYYTSGSPQMWIEAAATFYWLFVLVRTSRAPAR
jgi:membrane-bound metal-dependent hydrolase YbcI (DUF457 family)